MDQNDNPRILLSILWVFIVLYFFARDIHELGHPCMLARMMSGTIDGVVVTEILSQFSAEISNQGQRLS